MSYNGGEFNNGLYFEVLEIMGIEMVLWRDILYETMIKTIEDTKCEPSVGLAWSCCAKNSLQNHNGVSWSLEVISIFQVYSLTS